MKLHRLYEKWRCFIGKGIDIWSKNPYPSNVLSNLHDNPFEFDGVKCGSMEGFLQSLKYKDAVKQKEVCAMAGMDAKDMTNADWQANQIIWWKGQEINRQSKTFQELVMRAFQAMMSQNETFRMALLSTKGKTLYHSKGNNNPYKTILTRDEFCKILMELRSIVKTSPLTSEESTNTQDYFDKALNLEESGNLEEAYEYYRKAAEEGLSDAMFKLYDLYLNKGFHAKENNNMLELALSGKPVMPWDVTSQKVNDVESGIYWLRRAAEAGHIEACCIYGHRLCDEKDIDNGLSFLNKAAEGGHKLARLWHSYFSNHESVSDDEYNEILAKCFNTEGKIDLELAGILKDGKPNQLARYGYTLMSLYNKGLVDGSFLNYFMPKSNGIPYFPVAPKRGSWETFVRVNKDALPDGTLLTFTSDICVMPMTLQGLRIVGEAVYKSPSFGWLREEKNAVVFQVDSSVCLDDQKVADVARRYMLRSEEYLPTNVAFFEENGEKEYSVEIAEIKDGSVNVLYRYTIGGSDDVQSYFSPELIDLKINETEGYNNGR